MRNILLGWNNFNLKTSFQLQKGALLLMAYLKPLKTIQRKIECIFREFWKKKASLLQILQNCVTLFWKSQNQKPRPMEIPNEFLLITPRNSASFSFTIPVISTCYFFNTPRNSKYFFFSIKTFITIYKLKKHKNKQKS